MVPPVWRSVTRRGSSAASEESGASAAEAASPGLKALFFLRGIEYDRVFESLLRAMLERRHEVLVALDRQKGGLTPDQTQLFDELREQHPGFDYEQLPARNDRWLVFATAVRRGLDYLRHLERESGSVDPLDGQRPRILRALLFLPPFRWRFGRRFIGWMLRRLEAGIPIPRAIKAFVEEREPDVVLVSPLVEIGSAQGDYVRAAEAARIPSVLLVAGWDDLTSRGLVRSAPTRTIVWSERQVDEAVRLHALPGERVAALGAYCLDDLFDWRPASTREQFAARLGLDSQRPLVMYGGCSKSNETDLVRDWLSHVREDPRLRDMAVVLWPPRRDIAGWHEADLEEPGKTVIWPDEGAARSDPRLRHDYFDSLHHACAVIGVDSGALIEAAIVQRPALTLAGDLYGAPEGTRELARRTGEDGRGLLSVGRTWTEHLDQLADAVERHLTHQWEERQGSQASGSGGLHREREAFLAEFVHPRGVHAPAAPGAAEAIEETAAADVVPSRQGRFLRPLLWLLTPVLAIMLSLLQPRRTVRRLAKRVRRGAKITRGAISRRLQALRSLAGRRGRNKTTREQRALERKRLRAERQPEIGQKETELDPEEAMARAAMNEEKARVRAAKEEKAQARAAKEEKLRVRAAKKEKMRDRARKAEEKAQADAAKREGAAVPKEERTGRAAIVKKDTPEPARAAAGGRIRRGRIRRWRGRVRKIARGRAKLARRRWKYTRRGVRRVYNRRYRYSYKSTIMRVPARDELPALLNTRGLLGRGVEIGVKTGLYSNELLSNWRGNELVSIDPWLSADPDEYVDRSNVSQDEFEQYYQQTRERLEPYGSRSTIWRMTSLEAAPKIADRSLDFVYIDARHDYESVKEDLHAWAGKVKPGGILAGHDYVDGDFPQGEFYVKSAVDEFFAARDIPVRGTEGPSAVELFPTWIVEVPDEGIPLAPAQMPAARSGAGTEGGPEAASGGPSERSDAAAERAGQRSPA